MEKSENVYMSMRSQGQEYEIVSSFLIIRLTANSQKYIFSSHGSYLGTISSLTEIGQVKQRFIKKREGTVMFLPSASNTILTSLQVVLSLARS